MKDVHEFVREARTVKAAMRDYRNDADRIERRVAALPPYRVLTRLIWLNAARIARHAAQAEYFNPSPEDEQ